MPVNLPDLLDLPYQTDSQSATIRRPTPLEDAAMFMFANHAAHCTRCADPIEANLTAGVLCDLGNLFAWELARYLYDKDGRAYSLFDQRHSGQTVEIELPADCLVVLRLFRAVHQGLIMGQSSLTHGAAVLG